MRTLRSFKGLGGLNSESKPIVIAEACENHLGDIDVAKEMIKLAKNSGAEVIKFQHHLRDFEMIKGLKMSGNFDEDLYDFLGRCSLNIDQHIELKKTCEENNIKYLCTPFCKEAAAELLENNLLDCVKIGSGEMLDFRLLDFLANKKISMILSTGMSESSEIKKTFEFLSKKNADFAFLHCISEYPPSYEDINLDSVSSLQEKFPNNIIGFSCHTPSIYTGLAASILGAKIIEKHVIIDKNQKCPDQEVSISFEELKDLCEGIKLLYKSRGNSRKVFEKEKEIRSWARRVILASKTIKPGDYFNEQNLTTMRAGEGLSSEYFFELIGKKSSKFFEVNEYITEDSLKQ